jgi:mediator of RNA polymerase II transcription subunit 5
LIRSALSVSRAGKAPAVPISLCLTFLPPTQFLDIVWTELSVAASLGELEICRRLGTFVLTTPTTSRDPPLLPIFLHLLVPTLIASFDARQPLGPEQNMTLEFLVTLISSSLLCARHLEYALHSQGTSQSQNQPTSGRSLSMARRLFADLKTRKYGSRKSPTAGAITQRLMASQVFIASFPIVMGDAQ